MKHSFTLLILGMLVSTLTYGQAPLHKGYGKIAELKKEKLLNRSGIAKEDDIFSNSQNSQNNILKSSLSTTQVLDSTLSYSWDSSSSDWNISSKTLYSYDSDGNRIQGLDYSLDKSSSKWEFSSKTEYSYDAYGNYVLWNVFNWDSDNSIWVNCYKYDFAYDSDENEIQEIYSDWNATINEWVIEYKGDYSYNEDGTYAMDLESYYTGEGELEDSSKTVYNYDSDGNRTSIYYYEWDSSSSEWVTYDKYEYTYDSDGNMSQYLSYDWNTTSSEWVISSKTEYTYDSNGNQTQQWTYSWDSSNSEWVNSYKYEYSYDSNNKMTLRLYYTWDSSSSEWENGFWKYEYGFDSEGNRTQLIISIWDDDTSAYIGSSKYVYYYGELNTTGINDKEISTIKLYPNPVSDNLYISLTDKTTEATFVLYSLGGQQIITKDIEQSDYISLASLKSGIYYYTITVDGKKQSGKIIKK